MHLVDNYDLRSPLDWDDPVEWGPREFNEGADAICSLILDGQEDFSTQGDHIQEIVDMKPHLLVHTDGGCRNQGISALGYVIYGVIYTNGKYNYYTIAMGGAKVNGNRHSFELEALALNLALGRVLVHLSAGTGPGRPPKKRVRTLA